MTASTRPSPPSGTAALHLRQRRVLAILPMLALRAVRGSGWLRALHCLRRTAAVRTLCGRRTDGCLWRGLLLPSGWPSHPPQSTGNHLEAPGSLSTPLAGTQLVNALVDTLFWGSFLSPYDPVNAEGAHWISAGAHPGHGPKHRCTRPVAAPTNQVRFLNTRSKVGLRSSLENDKAQTNLVLWRPTTPPSCHCL